MWNSRRVLNGFPSSTFVKSQARFSLNSLLLESDVCSALKCYNGLSSQDGGVEECALNSTGVFCEV